MSMELVKEAVVISFISFGIMYIIWVAKILKKSICEECPEYIRHIVEGGEPISTFITMIITTIMFIIGTAVLAVMMPGLIMYGCIKAIRERS